MIVKTLIILITLLGIGIGSRFLLPKDNPAEEASEDLIEQLSGIELDFSPENCEEETIGKSG